MRGRRQKGRKAMNRLRRVKAKWRKGERRNDMKSKGSSRKKRKRKRKGSYKKAECWFQCNIPGKVGNLMDRGGWVIRQSSFMQLARFLRPFVLLRGKISEGEMLRIEEPQ